MHISISYFQSCLCNLDLPSCPPISWNYKSSFIVWFRVTGVGWELAFEPPGQFIQGSPTNQEGTPATSWSWRTGTAHVSSHLLIYEKRINRPPMRLFGDVNVLAHFLMSFKSLPRCHVLRKASLTTSSEPTPGLLPASPSSCPAWCRFCFWRRSLQSCFFSHLPMLSGAVCLLWAKQNDS